MDQRTLAFINLYGVLGSLRELCALCPEAQTLIADKTISIGFAVKGGPEATLRFSGGACSLTDGAADCDIRLPFSSPEKFNGMINGTVTPIPSKGFTKIGFLTKTFTRLTDLLTAYLKPEEKALQDEAFFNASTRVMFSLIVSAVAQIGNEDPIGKASASYIVDGKIKLCIGNGGPAAYLLAQNHRLTAVHEDTKDYFSVMEFDNMHLARALFDGKTNAVACIGTGQVRMGGMISQLDNVNRILDRVGQYLA